MIPSTSLLNSNSSALMLFCGLYRSLNLPLLLLYVVTMQLAAINAIIFFCVGVKLSHSSFWPGFRRSNCYAKTHLFEHIGRILFCRSSCSINDVNNELLDHYKNRRRFREDFTPSQLISQRLNSFQQLKL